jgi:copper chaperone CopZ
MTFATTKQLVLMTFLWAIALFGIDYAKNPRPLDELLTPPGEATNAGGGPPVITLAMNHLCCTGCLSDVTTALAGMPGISVRAPEMSSKEEAVASRDPAKDWGKEIELVVSDLRAVDFMAIDGALRSAGLVASRMELRGPRHYRLEATLNHMCCKACAIGAKEGLELTRGLRSQGRFKWLDSFDVQKEKKLIIANARYDAVADVSELVVALNHAGFQPSSIYATTSAETTRTAPGTTR